MVERIVSLEGFTPPVIITEVVKWGEYEEPPEKVKAYGSAKDAVFGREGIVSGGGVFKGEVSQHTIGNLMETTLGLIEEQSESTRNVFGNIPAENAKVIFKEAKQALSGESVYNRMLWLAVGIVLKEHTEETSKHLSRERMILHTGVDIRGNAIYLVKHTNKEARSKQLEELEGTLMARTEDVGFWLKENYPIDESELSIKSHLEK